MLILMRTSIFFSEEKYYLVLKWHRAFRVETEMELSVRQLKHFQNCSFVAVEFKVEANDAKT